MGEILKIVKNCCHIRIPHPKITLHTCIEVIVRIPHFWINFGPILGDFGPIWGSGGSIIGEILKIVKNSCYIWISRPNITLNACNKVCIINFAF